MPLPRVKKDIKYTSFLGNCCDEKVSTLSVCLENKQCTITPYATNSKISTRGSSVTYLLKHEKILYFRDPYLFIYLLKFYLSFLRQIAFANKFELYHKTKYNIIYYISLHIKHPQSISPIFLNSNNKWLDFTTTERLFHITEPRKWIAFVP